MKVLVINSVPTQKNGITNVIFNFLRAMKAPEIQVDVLAINLPDQTYINDVERRGGKIYVITRSGKVILKYFNTLKELIRKNKYDVVHVHGNSHTLALELMAAKLGGSKVRIAHSHNTTCKYIWTHRLLTPLFNRFCTHGLACGQDAGIWMFGDKPFQVLNNGVDTGVFSYQEDARVRIRTEYGIGDRKLLGHVGTFNAAKNQSFIVDILDELTQRGLDYYLMLIGDGALRKDVESIVSKKGLLDRVFFTGNKNDVRSYLSAIDLIVMPSLYEGLPLTLIEQQANGLQCVVADTITKEVDKTGNLTFLSLDDDLKVWADTIDNIECATGRQERSNKAIRDITESGYDINTEVKKLEYIYKSAFSFIKR